MIRIEGGYVNDKFDRGGATKYGISLRFMAIEGLLDLDKDGYADFDINRDGRLDALDIALLNPRNAEAIYLRVFFIETGFWSLPRPFDAALFDFGVNAGAGSAVKILQRALNSFGSPVLKVDGQLGPQTRRMLDLRQQEGAVLAKVRAAAAGHYRSIIANDPSQKRFEKGWLKRAEELGRVA
ncbi:glycoside hydrolase family 108 protein [Caulobacter henricii]|uniref:glycoside hydrolase family 108 protein n=1 Tax=Caulobacter henricii TaxID=69395 RepID=UPI00078189A3|nr:glycosyl hydrolase 108 family protein [Caulobacter henricii]